MRQAFSWPRLAGLMSLVAGVQIAAAQQPPDYCRIFLERPIFTSTTTTASASQKENFRLLECSSDFRSATDAQKAGIDVTVPIYDIPVPFSANWDSSKVETWKSSHCTAAERSGAASMAYFTASLATNPVSANDALACYVALFNAQGNDALRCELTETSNSYLFNARWRRTAGETGPGPVVTKFTTLNTDCRDSSELGPNKEISEGGVPVLCLVAGRDPGAFVLNTTRGGCSVAGRYRAPKLVMPLVLTLSGQFNQIGEEVEFPSGATVVTNGHPFNLSVSKLNLLGPVTIRSFTAGSAELNMAGSSASAVNLTARELVGVGGISVLNAGQTGGLGPRGSKGRSGQTGRGGVGRTVTWSSVCNNLPWPLNEVCKLAPTGCEGGEDGGAAAPAGDGNTGLQGLPGGDAGSVVIDVNPDGRKLVTVLTDVGLDGKSRPCGGVICGGAGGHGGRGGDGGDSALGGSGAQPSAYCGGTNDGPSTPTGGPGKEGPPGADGAGALPRG